MFEPSNRRRRSRRSAARHRHAPLENGSRRHAGRARALPTGGRDMTIDLTLRLGEIGAVLAEKVPGVLDATLLLLESCHLPSMQRGSSATSSCSRSGSVVTRRCSWASPGARADFIARLPSSACDRIWRIT